VSEKNYDTVCMYTHRFNPSEPEEYHIFFIYVLGNDRVSMLLSILISTVIKLVSSSSSNDYSDGQRPLDFSHRVTLLLVAPE